MSPSSSTSPPPGTRSSAVAPRATSRPSPRPARRPVSTSKPLTVSSAPSTPLSPSRPGAPAGRARTGACSPPPPTARRADRRRPPGRARWSGSMPVRPRRVPRCCSRSSPTTPRATPGRRCCRCPRFPPAQVISRSTPPSYPPSRNGDAVAAAGWLGRQLAAGGDRFTDWGVTEDAVLALAAAGVGGDQIAATAGKVLDSGDDYIGGPPRRSPPGAGSPRPRWYCRSQVWTRRPSRPAPVRAT